MYMPDNPIDRPQHIATNMLSLLHAVYTNADVSSFYDLVPSAREAAKRDLEHAIEMLNNIRGNSELVILRKIAFATRVYFSWDLRKLTQEEHPKLYYQF